MKPYPFNLVQYEQPGQIKDNSALADRPFTDIDRSFAADARRFVPGRRLETAINTAIAVGEPLLVTGEPGTGKTQTAYYTAYKLNVEPVIHFQVKSESTARDLLYHFDTVRYFHDAHLKTSTALNKKDTALNKKDYVEKRALWRAFERAGQTGAPPVVLIDEIDKAPRDFPNDLLHELDKMEFTVVELTDEPPVSAPRKLRPIVFITSNSERRLPEPFLRRCVYHHIEFNDQLVELAMSARKDEFSNLSEEFLKTAVQRFLAVRGRNLRKIPATGEMLVWLKVLSAAAGTYPEKLEEDLSKLPYLGVLLKDHQDMWEIEGRV